MLLDDKKIKMEIIRLHSVARLSHTYHFRTHFSHIVPVLRSIRMHAIHFSIRGFRFVFLRYLLLVWPQFCCTLRSFPPFGWAKILCRYSLLANNSIADWMNRRLSHILHNQWNALNPYWTNVDKSKAETKWECVQSKLVDRLECSKSAQEGWIKMSCIWRLVRVFYKWRSWSRRYFRRFDCQMSMVLVTGDKWKYCQCFETEKINCKTNFSFHFHCFAKSTRNASKSRRMHLARTKRQSIFLISISISMKTVCCKGSIEFV